jgi:hypothetical protein
MPILSKPKPCAQNWLAMQPTAKGRRCVACEKEIYDFSALSWPQIVQTQAAHGNRLCGMYSDAQLAHWGQAPPNTCAPLAAATALALVFTSLPAPAQTSGTAAALTLEGTVTALISPTGQPEPLFGTTVLLLGTTIGASTDAQGHYTLPVPETLRRDTLTLVFSSVGFVTQRLAVPLTSTRLREQNAQLVLDGQAEIFSVQMPSLTQRLKWRVKRWFGRSR